MRKDGVVGTSLYFSPKDKKHRDAYRVLSIYPRKKTELVTCLVQKFLAENGISDIEQVSDEYLQKIIRKELQENNYSVLIGVISALSKNHSTDRESEEKIVSISTSKKTDKKKRPALKDKTSSIMENDVKEISNDNRYEKNHIEKDFLEDNEIGEENDDTTGLTDDWQDKLGFFKL